MFGRAASLRRAYSKSPNPDLQSKLKGVLNAFNAPIRYAIAYGSGAYQQKGYSDTSDTMVDLMFGVTHAEHWHSLNLRQNPGHYSFVKHMGVKTISSIQERFGARIYYNPYIVIDGIRLKYGVVSMHHLSRDLEEWETMYLAGRLQKPVRILRNDAKVHLSSRLNLRNAVSVAMLMLPERFSEEDLYLAIAGLSYSGDFRMILGENPHKVFNIVYTQMDAFREKYNDAINDLPALNQLSDGSLEQDLSPKLRGSMIQSLPKTFQQKLHSHYLWSLSKEKKGQVVREEPNFSQGIGSYELVGDCVKKSIKQTVARPAFTQSLKGVLTAGFGKSIKYTFEKFGKRNK